MSTDRAWRSVKLHAQAAELREKAAAHATSYTRGATIDEIARVRDEAKLMRREAGAILRRARAAAKREGRTP